MMKGIAVCDGKILVKVRDGRCELPAYPAETPDPDGEVFTFDVCGETYKAFAAEGSALQEGMEYKALRPLWGEIPDQDHRAVGKGSELVFWANGNRFCGCCGSPMTRGTEISLRCPECDREIFPEVYPAVIVLVRKGDEALLVHAKGNSRAFYGLVAGFVETGESLEECVAREVREETSLEISNIRYVGSQPWPYPMQLMIGFTADYAGGDILFADGELEKGGFFDRNNLPPLPGHGSIARRMIEEWMEELGNNEDNI